MHLLEEMGMVKRFDFGDGAARFELVGENDDGHHHHLVCTKCSEVVEIEECFPEKIEKRIAAQNGFKAVTHKLEFFGICPDCSAVISSCHPVAYETGWRFLNTLSKN